MTDNGIRVPRQYEHLMRKERSDQSREYTEAIIRDHIKENPGRVITGAEFVKVTGVSSANAYLARLRKQGRVSRFQIKDGVKGFRYRYEWNDTPKAEPIDYRAPSPTITTSLNLPQVVVTPETIQKVDSHILNDAALYTADQVMGMIKLRNFLKEDMEAVDAKRKMILEERNRAHEQ